jgi:hypothetical protein
MEGTVGNLVNVAMKKEPTSERNRIDREPLGRDKLCPYGSNRDTTQKAR